MNKLEPPSPKNALCQVWLKLVHSGSGEEDFLISEFRNYLLLEDGGVPHLNKLESRLPKNAFCKVELKLAQWFLRRRFFKNFVNVFSLFRNYLPLEKGGTLHLNKLESLAPNDAFWRRR